MYEGSITLMATNWEGIGSKSYTLPGIEGGELTISETDDRLAIRVSITVKPGTLSVLLTAAQFHALCHTDSSYDGLQVREREAAAASESELPVSLAGL